MHLRVLLERMLGALPVSTKTYGMAASAMGTETTRTPSKDQNCLFLVKGQLVIRGPLEVLFCYANLGEIWDDWPFQSSFPELCVCPIP